MIKDLWNKYKSYVISILIALGVGGLSAIITMGQMDIFGSIKHPPLAPPAFLFPIVWTILYTLMGISSAIIYEKRDLDTEIAKSALSSYASSLIVNFAWSIIFFNFGAYLLSFIWILFLEALIIRTIIDYRKIDKLAAYLQIPYAVWVAFAGYLTFGIWILNR